MIETNQSNGIPKLTVKPMGKVRLPSRCSVLMGLPTLEVMELTGKDTSKARLGFAQADPSSLQGVLQTSVTPLYPYTFR